MSEPANGLPWSRRLMALAANALYFTAGFTLISGLLPVLILTTLYGLGLLHPPRADWVVEHAQFMGFHLAGGALLYLPFALLRRLTGAETRKAQSRLAALLALTPLWGLFGFLINVGAISTNAHGFGELVGFLLVYSCLLILGGGFAGALAHYQRQDPKRSLRIMAADIRQSARHGGQYLLLKLTDQAWNQIRRQSLGRCAAAFLVLALLFSGMLLMQSLTDREIAIRAGEMHVGLNRMRQMAEQPSLLKGEAKTFLELAALTDHLDRSWNSFRMLSPGTGKDLNATDKDWQALRTDTRSLLALQPELQRLHAEELSLRSDFEHTRKQLEAQQARLLGIMLSRKEPVRHIAQIQDLSAMLSKEAAFLAENHAFLYQGLERHLVQEDGGWWSSSADTGLVILNELLSDPRSPRIWYSAQEWTPGPDARPVMLELRNALAAWVQRRNAFRPNDDDFFKAFHLRPSLVIQSRKLDQRVQDLAARQPEPGGLIFLSLMCWLCFGLCLYGMALTQRPGWEPPVNA